MYHDISSYLFALIIQGVNIRNVRTKTNEHFTLKYTPLTRILYFVVVTSYILGITWEIGIQYDTKLCKTVPILIKDIKLIKCVYLKVTDK